MKLKPYPEYKDSGVEWLSKVPVGWKYTRHKFITSFIKGRNPQELIDDYSEGFLPYLSMDYLRGQADPKYVSPEQSFCNVGAGQTLLLWDGANAGEFIPSKEGVLSSTVAWLKPKGNISGNFHWYYCKAVEHEVRRSSVGMGIPHVNGDELKSLVFPVPSFSEQSKIAKFLDEETAKLDTLIAKQVKLIELLQEKRQAIISHAVTKGLDANVKMKDSGVEWLGMVPEHWKVQMVRRCLLDHKQGYYPSAPYTESGVRLLRITDLRPNGGVDFTESPFVASLDVVQSFLLKTSDFVFARTGGAGLFGVMSKIDEAVAFASYLIRFRFDHSVNVGFMKYYFLSSAFQDALKQNIHGGVNQNVHAEDIKNQYIALPHIKEQEFISLFLDREIFKIRTLIEKSERTIELAKEHRTALISAAVTGKIDVREYA